MSERKPSQRFHSLNTEQVEVLHQVLSEVVPIHGRGNFPTLELRPRDIIIAVRARLQRQGITVRDVRLNGSTASHVLVRDNGTSYKDLDIIFGVELPSQEEFQVIKESVLGCLLDCLPAGVNRERISSATMKEAYVQKMVKVFNEHDRWSLISLSNNSGKNLELKFVSVLRRQFEFSVDSFQIILDRLLESYMQQETQHKMNSVALKEETAESRSTAAGPDRSGPGKDSEDPAHVSRTQQRDEVQEKESQTDVSLHSEQCQQTEESNMEEETNEEEVKEEEEEEKEGEEEQQKEKQEEEQEEQEEEETPVEVDERSENREDSHHTDQSPLDLRQTSERPEPPAPAELRSEPQLLDQNQSSAEAQLMKPGDGPQPEHSNHEQLSVEEDLEDHPKPPEEQNQLTEQMTPVEEPKGSEETQEEEDLDLDLAGGPEQSDPTGGSSCVREDQRSSESGEGQHESAADTNTLTHTHTESAGGGEAEAEICEQIRAGSQTEPHTEELTEQVSASGAEPGGDAADLDRSGFVSASLTQDTQQSPSTPDQDHSDQAADTLDAVGPPNTQDTLATPPSLVSDRKTSSCPPSCKASERLSHMVVLKHSSPKPPRRMCRKVPPSPNPSPVPDGELTPGAEPSSCLSPESELVFDVKPAGPSSDPTAPTSPPLDMDSGSEHNPFHDPASSLDFTSATDPGPDRTSTTAVGPTSTLPQEPASCQPTTGGSSLEDQPSTLVTPGEEGLSSPGETPSGPEQSEPVDSGDLLVLHSDPPEPVHTSEAELSHETPNTTHQHTKNLDLDLDQPHPGVQEPDPSSPSSSRCVTPPVSCRTPPVLSLSPPCFTPSPQSLSPPPCLTPPPHCLSSPMLNTVSPATSFSSPPLSFSPTSSCLSSPPYLTPPMLSLSPPPLCLSPPLLCLTPPVESEDLEPQVSPDVEPLIVNAGGEEQIEAPLVQIEDEKEQVFTSSLPQLTERVSFPITIPSSTTQVLSPSPSGASGDSAPPRPAEASDSVPENKEAPRAAADRSGTCEAPQASDSVPDVEVLAESMYGDFEAAMDHLRYRLIATRNPEEIRGGGLLKYSNLLVRDYRPASETQIKTLERYMCSRFFIDFPDVQEQQRKILSYLKNHFIGEERSKYQYLMTLRRVVDDSTVCLMGHERRQTLNMITVLALKVLGEQNIIPNTDHVTCFYQPAPYLAEHSAPYLAEPSYCSYYIPQGGSTLLYQPYPLHLHPQTGLV